LENLTYLMAAYFHEDWNHTYTTWQAVVDDFLTDNPARVKRVPGEIDEFLSSTLDDRALEGRLIAMGCAYDPPEGDRAWLEAVRDRIRDDFI
jgi:CdiI immunity protein